MSRRMKLSFYVFLFLAFCTASYIQVVGEEKGNRYASAASTDSGKLEAQEKRSVLPSRDERVTRVSAASGLSHTFAYTPTKYFGTITGAAGGEEVSSRGATGVQSFVEPALPDNVRKRAVVSVKAAKKPAPVKIASAAPEPEKPVPKAKPAVVKPKPAPARKAAKPVSYSESDLEMLARIVFSEARGEPYQGQVAVAAVVLNRVQSGKYSGTIRGVVFQRNAFTSVRDGQYRLKPNKTAYRAAREALNGSDPSRGAIYYYNPKIATSKWIRTRPQIVRIGSHIFAR